MAKKTPAATAALPEFDALVAERAYFKSEKRGFAPGFEIEDWLEAEAELGKPAKPKAKKRSGKTKKAEAA